MELTVTIDRFEGDQAVLLTDAREKILWPQAKLPAGAAEGAVLSVTIKTDEEAKTTKTALAKDILNELLGNADKT